MLLLNSACRCSNLLSVDTVSTHVLLCQQRDKHADLENRATQLNYTVTQVSQNSPILDDEDAQMRSCLQYKPHVSGSRSHEYDLKRYKAFVCRDRFLQFLFKYASISYINFAQG